MGARIFQLLTIQKAGQGKSKMSRSTFLNRFYRLVKLKINGNKRILNNREMAIYNLLGVIHNLSRHGEMTANCQKLIIKILTIYP